jgi:hypothetical protein
MEERTRRVGVNEAVFRAANERLEELNETFATISEAYSVVCECGDASCVEQFEMSPDEYRELREDPTTFAVIAGHEDVTSETIIDRRPGYVIVQKHRGGPAELAASTE